MIGAEGTCIKAVQYDWSTFAILQFIPPCYWMLCKKSVSRGLGHTWIYRIEQ